MRRIIVVTAMLVIALLGYTVWPLYALKQLAGAAQARDVSALSELVDHRSVRQSVSEQLIGTYLRLTGRAPGPLINLVAAVGTSVLDPFLEEFLDPTKLADFLINGQLSPSAGDQAPVLAPLHGAGLQSGWRIWLASEYSGRVFSVSLPPEKRSGERVWLQLRLRSWRWRLVGIELPEALRERLVQAVIKAAPAQ
jgi:hypothetical protein